MKACHGQTRFPKMEKKPSLHAGRSGKTARREQDDNPKLGKWGHARPKSSRVGLHPTDATMEATSGVWACRPGLHRRSRLARANAPLLHRDCGVRSLPEQR